MKHILIVEDDTTFAVMLQTWLSKKKFSVVSVLSLIHISEPTRH